MENAVTKQDQFLLAGERIDIGASVGGLSGELSDYDVNEKFIKGKKRMFAKRGRYQVSMISKIFKDDAYCVNPEYQRRHRWSLRKKSKLIESLIMNMPIPGVFLFEYDHWKFEVMDGVQRLKAIRDFYSEDFELEGLTEWPELNGRSYESLPDTVRTGIDRRYIYSVTLVRDPKREEAETMRLKQFVFERLNSGGAKLQEQETRSAIFDGPMNQLCIKLSKNPSLCRLWGIPEATHEETEGGDASEERLANRMFCKMMDVELVLRFFAYRQRRRLSKSRENLSTYLDRFLQEGNRLSVSTLQDLAKLFENTVLLTEDLLGEHAFVLFKNQACSREANCECALHPAVTVYDSLMFTLSTLLGERGKLLAQKSEIQEKLNGFYKENGLAFEDASANARALAVREKKLLEFFSTILDSK